jgi:hypothetical protein
MHRRQFTSLAASLLLVAGAYADEASKDQEKPAQVIRWTGSAYEEGDAFTVIAEIFPSRVELHWDGFGGDTFEFMDDPQQKAPPRVKKDHSIKDEATVQAFKTIVAQVEQCNPGESGALGQGVSTRAAVESPPGKAVKEMYFFATPFSFVKPRRFESIPLQMRNLVNKELPELIPAENPFATSIRDLAADLSRFAVCRDKLLAAYKAKDELPLPEMEALRLPVSLNRALSHRRVTTAKEDQESSRKLLAATKAVLRDCSGPVQRVRFTDSGEGRGEGGIVVALTEVRLDPNFVWGNEAIPPECISVELGTEGQPLAQLPKELEDLLVDFLGAPALGANAYASRAGFCPMQIYQVGITRQGMLELGLTREGRAMGGAAENAESLAASLNQAELKARLEYLFLLVHEVAGGKIPALVRIESLEFKDKEAKQAKIRFLQDGRDNVAEVHLVDSKWMPVKFTEEEE